MADRWLARIKRHENAMEARLADELQTLAMLAATVYSQYARTRTDDGRLIIEDTASNRAVVKDAVWNRVVAPYFGVKDNQLDGTTPRTPFMRLIVEGIEGAVRIQVERQVALIEQIAPTDVVQFLTGNRAPQLVGEQGGGQGRRPPWYDPFHRFVDENGYTLSDKGWRVSQETREAIDAILDQHIKLGTSAVDMAELLEGYLYPEAARIRTRTPYGVDGSYWARRLARTEITAAAGRSTINAAMLNPFVDMIAWRVSLQHKDIDICDQRAAEGPYPVNAVPPYPAHPHDGCTLVPLPAENRRERVRQMQDMLIAGYDEQFRMGDAVYTRRQLQGAFNGDWLVNALLSGAIVRMLEQIYQ